MGANDREIEQKLIVTRAKGRKTLDMHEVEFHVRALFHDEETKYVDDHSKDVFWRGPGRKFMRVRFRPQGGGQFTLKDEDKGNNVDRVEVDVEVDHPDKVVRIETAMRGKPTGELWKAYYVHVLEDEHTTVSVYSVDDDPKSRVFIEVEATNHERMRALEETVKSRLEAVGLSVEKAPGSLFSMFFGFEEGVPK
jgi:adenylate cyclase class IV